MGASPSRPLIDDQTPKKVNTILSNLDIQQLIEDKYLTKQEAEKLNADNDTVNTIEFLIPGLIKNGIIVKLADATDAPEEKILGKTMSCSQALQLPDAVLQKLLDSTVSQHVKNGNISISALTRQNNKHQLAFNKANALNRFAESEFVSISDNLRSKALNELQKVGIISWNKMLYIDSSQLEKLETPGVVDLLIEKKGQLIQEKKEGDYGISHDEMIILNNELKTLVNKISSMPCEVLKELESKELRNKVITGELSLDEIEGFSILPEVIKETTIQHIQDLIEKDPVAALKFIEKIYPPQREENLVQVKYDLNAVHNEMYPLIVKAMMEKPSSYKILGKESIASAITVLEDNYDKCKSYLTENVTSNTLLGYAKMVNMVYRTQGLDKATLDGLKTKTFNTANTYIEMFKTQSLVAEKRDLNFQRNHGGGMFKPQPKKQSNQQLLTDSPPPPPSPSS